MKKILLTLTCLLSLSVTTHAEDIKTDSKIEAVMLYPGSARITRTATIDISEGTHKIILPNLIPSLNKNTITVSGTGNANVLILGANLKQEQVDGEAHQRRKELLEKIEQVNDKIVDQNNTLQVLNKESDYLNSIHLFSEKQLPKDLVTTMPSADTLAATNTFLSQNLTRILSKKTETNITIRELKKELNRINRELSQIPSQSKKWVQSIVVDAKAISAGTLTLNVSYLVYNANWSARYDARTDLNKGEIELISYGLINQNTGEDWRDVKLTLSTAEPTLYGRMPEVTPWVLNPYHLKRSRSRAGASAPAMKGMMLMDMEESTDALMSTRQDMQQEAKVAYAASSKKGLSVVYDIATPATILSDGSENKLPIFTQTLAAAFSYSTYPKAQQKAFLNSKVTNSKELQLLAGPINLFLEGDYIGESYLDNIAPSQDFDLYLGVDDNVKIKREELSKKVDDVLIAGISAGTKKTTYQYKITMENFKDKAITLNLFEPMPVSGNDRIKVKLLKNTSKPTQKDWKQKKGVWMYKIKLKPQAKQEITYSFMIEHPKDMNIGL